MALAIQDRAARIQASCFAVVQSTPSLKILGDWLDHHDLHMRLGSIATLGSFGTAAVPMLQQHYVILRLGPSGGTHARCSCFVR